MTKLPPLSSALAKERWYMQIVRKLFAFALHMVRRFNHLVRVVLWLGACVCVVIGVALLGLRYIVLPNINHYKADIETFISEKIKLNVTIGHIEARWEGMNPFLKLNNVLISDIQKTSPFTVESVSTEISLKHILIGQVHTQFVEINRPFVRVIRDVNHDIWIGGVKLPKSDPNKPHDPSLDNWLLSQNEWVINQGNIEWQDWAAHKPTVYLADINLLWRNSGRNHQFTLQTSVSQSSTQIEKNAVNQPPVLELRGDITHGLLSDASDVNNWYGSVYAHALYGDFGVLKQHIDLPLQIDQGLGHARAWIKFDQHRLESINADLALEKAVIHSDEQTHPIRINSAKTNIQLTRHAGERIEHILRVNNLEITANDTHFSPTNIMLRYELKRPVFSQPISQPNQLSNQSTSQPTSQLTWRAWLPTKGTLSIDQLNVTPIRMLLTSIKLPTKIQQIMSKMQPTGLFNNILLNWENQANQPLQYTITSAFDKLGVLGFSVPQDAPDGKPKPGIPGIQNIHGNLALSQNDGHLLIEGNEVGMNFPDTFEHERLIFETFKGKFNWQINPGQLLLNIEELTAKNTNGGIQAAGSYKTHFQGPGELDIKGRLTYGDARAVWRYIPLKAPETARTWLKDNLMAGSSDNTQFEIKGDLSYFPFPNSEKGLFKIQVDTHDTDLSFMKDWPVAKNVHANLVFEGTSMKIHAHSAILNDVRLHDIDVGVANFKDPSPTLDVSAKATGELANMLAFVKQTNIAQKLEGKLDPLIVRGQGDLDYKMTLPFKHVEDIRLTGEVNLQNNDVMYDKNIPVFEKASGIVKFSQQDFSLERIKGVFMGGNVELNAHRDEHKIYHFNVDGETNLRTLAGVYPNPIWSLVDGNTHYQAHVQLGTQLEKIEIDSDLAGLGIQLPKPFDKQPLSKWPTRIVIKPTQFNRENEISQETWDINVNHFLTMQVTRELTDEHTMQPVRGAIGLNATPAIPKQGFNIAANIDALHIDEWQALASKFTSHTSLEDSVSSAQTAYHVLSAINQIELSTPLLTLKDKKLKQLKVKLTQDHGDWLADFKSEQAAGKVLWSPKSTEGKLKIDLAYLLIPEEKKEEMLNNVAPKDTETLTNLPELDINIGRFVLYDKEVGRVELLAQNESGKLWRLKKILIENPEGQITGDGTWQADKPDTPRQVNLNLRLSSGDVGKLLTRLGLGKSISKGDTLMEAQVSWLGSPLSIDYPTLNGNIKLNVQQGQFLVNVGAARLLSLLSLQALPRRLALDFRDIFSEGFAFDEINAVANIKKGILYTDDFKMTSTAATIFMNGNIDLDKETQHLLVNIYPDMTPDVATTTGVILANPAIGVGTFFARLLFRKPLSKAFSRQYLITGTWDDPKIEQQKNRQEKTQ